ncbi:hypothetical protein BN940_01281 [Castellaniella defragrans 65Phen]|uniref:Uncharacterized protein n=1 Tax=Castellaniella defragrans (strain DSM 12143 / CCUG 39792 / 65Phen) TaxID=1437824 RepID=W8WST8_CASD6|nr:hypothetical protein BN940_01281 [Castellaniella defragrans 65Phen]
MGDALLGQLQGGDDSGRWKRRGAGVAQARGRRSKVVGRWGY